MANENNTQGFWGRLGSAFRAGGRGFGEGIRDFALDNFTREGWRGQLEGGTGQDARALARAGRYVLGGPQAVGLGFLNSGLREFGRDFLASFRNQGYQGPQPEYGDMSPTRGTVSVGNINTDGSGVPYAINQSTGQIYQNSYPGLTGSYTHHPANTGLAGSGWNGVYLPYIQPAESNTQGLPGITSSLAGSGYGPSSSGNTGWVSTAGNYGAGVGAYGAFHGVGSSPNKFSYQGGVPAGFAQGIEI